LSNFYSLANRFFDYLQAGIPQLGVNYPVYKAINDTYNIAVLLDDISEQNIAKNLNQLLENEELYQTLQANCMLARKELNWQNEEKKLIAFYKNIFG
jgi:glycosyltransferase involved in cell wall biosynthesis